MYPSTPDLGALPPERLLNLRDASIGIEGVIVLHSTRSGAALAACRVQRYPDAATMTGAAIRLAERATYRHALAGLPFGGGQVVLRTPAPQADRQAVLAALGRAIEMLDGAVVAWPGMGFGPADMAATAAQTGHVVADAATGPGPSTAQWTARGLFVAIEHAVRTRLGRDLAGARVAVQGVGQVGLALCAQLHAAGAQLVLAEPRSARAAQAAVRFDAEISRSDRLADMPVDVLAPCGPDATIDAEVARRMRAPILCGSACAPLADAAAGAMLAARDVFHVPGVIANAGGAVAAAAHRLGWGEGEVRDRIAAIPATIDAVAALARARRIDMERAAEARARMLLARTRPETRAAA